jgi:hypothetical protein
MVLSILWVQKKQEIEAKEGEEEVKEQGSIKADTCS